MNELNNLIELLSSKEKNNAKIELIGKSLDRKKINIKRDYQDFVDSLGNITTELLCESSIRSIPAYCEDYVNRLMGKEEFGNESFGTRALLEMMFYNGTISGEEFNDALMDLIKLNYHFINISTDTLKRLARRNGYIVNEEVLTVLDEFRRPNQRIGDLLSLSASFLKWIWDEIDNDGARKRWTISILNAVSHRRNKKNIAAFFEDFAERGIHKLDAIKKKKIKELIDTWKQAQLIL